MPLQERQVEQLKTARAKLKFSDKWLQYASKLDDCYCLWGAIFSGVVENQNESIKTPGMVDDPVYKHVVTTINELGYPYNSIPQFNDATGRTYEQVIKVLDRAIETA